MRPWPAAALAAALAFAPAAAAGPPDAIRTGGPSSTVDAKIAVVVSSQPMAGKRFKVVGAGGRTVLAGRLKRTKASPKPWRRAAIADLTALTAPGTYRVKAGKLTSRPWVIGDDEATAPIATMLAFFAANSDGNEPSPVHGPAHLNDAEIYDGPYAGQRFDLTGGWMDAGDMVKFTQTTGHSAALLQAAARLAPARASSLNAAADVGIRWLLKAHPKPDLFVAQVGDQRDHDVSFRDPAADDASGKPGIALRPALTGLGSDLAGKAAAALALAADRTSGDVHDLLLRHAREWYELGGRVEKAAKLEGAFYESDSWVDDMAAGAAALYRTTGDPQYLADALDYMNGSNMDSALGWSEFGAFAAADLCGALGAPPAADPAGQQVACGHLARAAQTAAGRARTDLMGMPGAYGWGSTAENGQAGAIAALADRAGVFPGGFRIAAGARDWLLGRNNWGASFVTGFGPRSPRHPHHWASVFGSGLPKGAVVGGPAPRSSVAEQKVPLPPSRFNTRTTVYADHLENYVTSEPAIDYTASSILLVAALTR